MSVAKRRINDLIALSRASAAISGFGDLEATRRICEECGAKVLVLSQYDEEENILVSSQAGALGFIPKRSAGSQLVAAIRSASLQ